jgi:fluoroquinolone transport system permease protein
MAAVTQDIRLQWRNGFYYASGFVALILILLMSQLNSVDFDYWWPPIILENLVINAYYFMSGLVLLEKGEGTLEALLVTPLTDWEYLSAKVLSLVLLATLETCVVVVVISGLPAQPHWLLLGLLLLIGIFALYGFVVVARYDSISEFLMPSILWTMAYSLPLLGYFNFWRSPLLYLHPIQAPLSLMEAAFMQQPAWKIWYGILYGGLWLGLGFYFSRRVFYQFIVRKEGVF